jgi:hypothetical protein
MYDAIIATARDLIGDSAQSNPEYTRGIVELIANTYGPRYNDEWQDSDNMRGRILRDLGIY